MFSLQLKWFSSRGAAAPARSFETDGIKEARLNQPQSALMGGGGLPGTTGLALVMRQPPSRQSPLPRRKQI